MTEFRKGDKVLVRASVKEGLDGDGEYFLESDIGGHGFYLMAHAVEPAPEPPYVDPELVPGMVVAAVNSTDDRAWFVVGGSASTTVEGAFGFRGLDDLWFHRHELPARLRVVLDPRRVDE